MKLRKNGISEEEIFNNLQEFRKNDFNWRSGKLFSFVYHPGDEVERIIKKAYTEFLTENGLDPTVFPSLRKMESEVVSYCANFLNGDENVVGNMTTGGTESIILAIKTARDYARKNKPEITEPEVILPYTVHSAFFKACQYLDVKPVVSALTSDYRADVKDIQSKINKNTILITASAPSYAYGVIDPIEEIGKLALEHNILMHVDACVGGMMVPFLKKNGYNVRDFDFSVPGVTSISVDLHKYGYAAKGASVVLYKNNEIRKSQYFVCTEWTGYTVVNATILSSKSGGPIAAAYAVMNYFGEQGYIDLAKETMETTQKFIEGIKSIKELQILGNPETTLVAFSSPKVNIYSIADEMNMRGWNIQVQFSSDYAPANIHLTVVKAHKNLVDEFISDLKDSVAKAKKFSLSNLKDRTTILSAMEMSKISSTEAFTKLAKLIGLDIENQKLPERMAILNELMDKLPDELVKPLLLEFVSGLYCVKTT